MVLVYKKNERIVLKVMVLCLMNNFFTLCLPSDVNQHQYVNLMPNLVCQIHAASACYTQNWKLHY